MSDIYYTGILPESNFRFTLIDCSEISSHISRIHNLDSRMINFLSKSLMGAFFLARMVKGDQRISIQWKDEFKQSVLAYSNRLGHMKGVAYPGEFQPGDIRNDFILGTGILKVIRWKIDADPYTSFSNLVEDTFETNFINYLNESEQVTTYAYMDSFIPKDGYVNAKGIFLQALPEATEESKTKIFNTANPIFQLPKTWEISVKEIYAKLGEFFDEKVLDLDSGVPIFQCDCSRNKIADVLVSLGRSEIQRIIEQEGKVEVECEFCKSLYDFDDAQAGRLFSHD
ncbi:MAG: Hsp33 family molecular chaperone HslO [Leptospira sp.]|nr:Hsp33 family molecular chaperone HslO [Leptospira sp.]